jgi:hypothetical protein
MMAIFQNRSVKWVLAPVVVLWALGWAYFQYEYPTCTFRYKLTAEVMTPDGMKTGSSVIEVSYSNFASLSGVPNLILSVVGEANFVDLGNGKNLFFLLTNRASGRNLIEDFEQPKGALDALKLPLKALDLHWHIGNQRDLVAQLPAARSKGRVYVPFENLPTLIAFKNLSNAESVVVLQPDELSKIYGIAYQLKNVTLEITDDYPQGKIEIILPWLNRKKIEWENVFGFGINDPLITQLFYDSFKQPYKRGH